MLVYSLGNSFLKRKSDSEILKTRGLKKHQFLLEYFHTLFKGAAPKCRVI